MLIVELCFLVAFLVVAVLFGKKSHQKMQDQTSSTEQPKSVIASAAKEKVIDEVAVYRDARLLNEYINIMLSFDDDKMHRMDEWQIKVLKGTRFVPGSKK